MRVSDVGVCARACELHLQYPKQENLKATQRLRPFDPEVLLLGILSKKNKFIQKYVL